MMVGCSAPRRSTSTSRTSRPLPRGSYQARKVAMTEIPFMIGASVSCSDGACGEVTRVVLNPVSHELTHLVVEPAGRIGLGRLVPLDLADATDGEIGHVEGLVIDPRNHHVTHVLLQEGHLWGRKEVSIPIGAVTGTEDGIRLNLTKDDVRDLPPVHIDHPA